MWSRCRSLRAMEQHRFWGSRDSRAWGHHGGRENGTRVLRPVLGQEPAHLAVGVHEDEMLAVQSQEAGSGQGQLTHPQHHIDSVAKEGQLAHSLWERRGQDRCSGRSGPGTCPTWPPAWVSGAGQVEKLPQPLHPPSLLGLLPRPLQLPGPRPTDEADLCFLGAADLQLPQLLVHQVLYGGYVHLRLQRLWQVSQQVSPRTQTGQSRRGIQQALNK